MKLRKTLRLPNNLDQTLALAIDQRIEEAEDLLELLRESADNNNVEEVINRANLAQEKLGQIHRNALALATIKENHEWDTRHASTLRRLVRKPEII